MKTKKQHKIMTPQETFNALVQGKEKLYSSNITITVYEIIGTVL